MPSNKSVGFLGVGHYLPINKVPNSHFVERGMDTSPEWIESRSGIQSRHIVAQDEFTSDLAVKQLKWHLMIQV